MNSPTQSIDSWTPIWDEQGPVPIRPTTPIQRQSLLNLSNSSSPTTNISTQQMLGKRNRDPDTNSMEKQMKQLRIETKWHHKYIFDNNLEMMVENQSFIPKYLADIIPLPYPLLDNIYNKMLTFTEQMVLRGEWNWITNYYEIPTSRIIGHTLEGNKFCLARDNPFYCNENYPF